MKRRPWILILFALAHFFAPFVNLIFDAYLAQTPFLRYVHLFFMPHNFSKHWFHFFAPMAAGIAIYICQRWTYYIYVSLMASLAFVSYASYLYRVDLHNPWPLVMVYGFNFIMVSYFLLPAVRNVYFDPRLRWWETSPRYNANIDCNISSLGQKATGLITNFSESGLFLKSDLLPSDHSFIQIEFTFDDLQFQFQGQVIRHGQQNVHGFGVRFFLNPAMKKSAASLAQRLHLKGQLQAHRLPTEEDSFRWWITSVLKSGKGLLPSSKK